MMRIFWFLVFATAIANGKVQPRTGSEKSQKPQQPPKQNLPSSTPIF